MDITDFYDAEDAVGVPADDIDAFQYFAQIANDKFSSRVARLMSDEEEWRFIQEARYSFQNYICAIGSVYSVHPFMNMPIQNIDDYGHSEWQSFKAVLDRKMATLFHSKIRAAQTNGFLLTETAKEGIRRQLSGLREYILNAQLPQKTKEKLIGRVDEFEKALNERRMNMTAIWTFTGFVLGVFADGSTIGDSTVVNKLLSNVYQVASEEIVKTEEISKLMEPKSPLQISQQNPNTYEDENLKPQLKTASREVFSNELVDEVPF